MQLHQGEVDSVLWRWESPGCYSSKSAYRAFFIGSIRFSCAEDIWRARVPLKCKIFVWLAIRRRCWTTDRLRRRGLPNQGVCVFCGHVQETIDHLLLGCAMTAQVWAWFLKQVGFRQPSLQDHWLAVKSYVPKQRRKDLGLCLIPVCWMIRKERNQMIFNNKANTTYQIFVLTLSEHRTWRMASATSMETHAED